MSTYHPTISLLGRILLSAIFLVSGISKISDWNGTAGMMSAHGMSAVPFFLTVAILVEIVGGLALLTGWHTRLAALMLFLYLIPTTLIFHNFWAVQGAAQQMQTIHFLKNLAIMGGLLEFVAVGAYAISMDAVRARHRGWYRFWRARGTW